MLVRLANLGNIKICAISQGMLLLTSRESGAKPESETSSIGVSRPLLDRSECFAGHAQKNVHTDKDSPVGLGSINS